MRRYGEGRGEGIWLVVHQCMFPLSNFPSNVGGGSEIPFKERPLI